MPQKQWAADNVERRSVKDLIPYERNPKLHPDSQIEQIANSIREWGWTIPVLIDPEGNVIAGHGRLYAAQKLDIKDVPCLVAEGWSEQQKRAYVIADNKLAENSEWDTGQYFSELKAINEVGFDLSLMGIDSDLSFLNYSPNLEPEINFKDVSDADVESAGDAMSDRIEGIASNQRGVEVMCPYCAETFKFTGN